MIARTFAILSELADFLFRFKLEKLDSNSALELSNHELRTI